VDKQGGQGLGRGTWGGRQQTGSLGSRQQSKKAKGGQGSKQQAGKGERTEAADRFQTLEQDISRCVDILQQEGVGVFVRYALLYSTPTILCHTSPPTLLYPSSLL
jgi:hypothetical protein